MNALPNWPRMMQRKTACAYCDLSLAAFEREVVAGHFRNQQMIDEGKPDAAIIFPGGSGTADMANRIKKAGIPHWEITLP